AGYAAYYDLLYAGKEYEAECDFLESVWERFGVRPRSVLDLACGTGGHALPLARRGYELHGVDLSAPMLAHCEAKARAAGVPVTVVCQDLRSLALHRTFDAAICMFDAIGYLAGNDDLRAGLTRIRAHVAPGGLFVCDFWHAAAILRAHAQTRVREFPLPDGKGIRLSTTTLDPERQVGEVQFRVLAFQGDRLTADVTEVHPVRYFLPQEMRFILEATGWRPLWLCPAFDLDAPISAEAWHLVAVATPA
ncbi:MAG: class I SAM-dependent methyltransferase, partial [SAR202 cluster bacterium]|nr:class I SAM-dependent methyltransferase [SAR202 cluster bacterium]